MTKDEILESVVKYVNQCVTSFEKGRDTVQYSGPFLDSDEFVAIIDSVLDGWFGLGKKTLDFEDKTASLLGKEYGVYVNSGSSANLIALEVLKEKYCERGKKYKIITSAASFPTTVNSIIQLGFQPVFVDVELGTYNLDEKQVLDALRDESVIGLVYAHPLGIPVKNTKLYYEKIKERNGFLIEDCCDALGSKYEDDIPVGSYSDAATLSLYAAHHITTGEGGLAAFNTVELQKIAKSYRDWGRACYCTGKGVLSQKGACKNRFSDWLNIGVITDHRYVYDRVGYNLKPLELQAAMGLAQLRKLDTFTSKRKENFQKLNEFMKQYEDYLLLPYAPEGTDPSWFSYPITVRSEAPFRRADIVDVLERNKIQTRNFFAGNILDHPGYKRLDLQKDYSLENSSMITTNTFMIGVWPGITQDMYDHVFDVVENYFSALQ